MSYTAVLSAVLAVVLGVCAQASAAGTVGWTLRGVAQPSSFSTSEASRCQSEERCDSYQLLVTNVGDEASNGTITLTDKLPPGIVTVETPESGIDSEDVEWACTSGAGKTTVTCTFPDAVPAGGYAPFVDIHVSAPGASMSGSLHNEASVAGGGAAAMASASEETPIGGQTPPFAVSEFGVEPSALGGAPALGAGERPWEITGSFGIPSIFSPRGTEASSFEAVEHLKSAVVELPAGLVGDPLVTPQRCTPTELRQSECPAASRVGAFGIIGDKFGRGEFGYTGKPPANLVSALYNVVPEGGYPAEFGFTFAEQTIFLYASVVHNSTGYRLRLTTPGIPAVLDTSYFVLTFFGDPGKFNEGSSEPGFLTNPVDCSAGALSSRIELASWNNPGRSVSREATMYPQLSGCDLLGFDPSLSFVPSPAGGAGTTQADEPSGYTVDVRVPQTTAFNELATPEVKDVSVALPEGVAISPAAGDGLAGCGEAQIALDSTSAGACPLASQIGTVEATTPVLSEPLQGHVYIAQPKCGGEGQPACTAASATNGELYGLYVEVQGPGFAVKLPGVVSADPVSGRVTARFENLIQQPFSDLVLHLKGGPRAPLANPQTCGTATTSSVLEPWSAPATPDATVSSSFNVDWDGQGGACPASLPFAPGFAAGTVSPSAGAFSPFTVTFSRRDREQDLSGIGVRMPAGLLGVLKSVPLCGEPQAAQGTCGVGSLIGHTTATAGAGSNPFSVSGGVFLTGPYRGAPFGLSIVVPAVAGPFNLGNVVVRAAINVDPHTAQVLVTSDPLPQIVDGVPLRIQTVNVTIDRQGFLFNPTSCAQQQVTGTITAAQGATANVSSPFAVNGCAGLAFKPSFTVSTQARTSKRNGASLDVRVGYPTGGETNIRSVAVTLPRQLPSRLTTIQQACPQATFDANPASCPAGSNIGVATAFTPILAGPLVGPAYLVSHGGAAFPDLVVILQGEGVTVDLTGSINIKKGITSSTFASVPDAPISSFELKLPEGPHSGLAAVLPAKAKGSLCGTRLTMPTTLTGQNGAQVKQNTKIQVTGCAKAKKTKPKKKKHAKGKRRRG